jgi:hypothetical protein
LSKYRIGGILQSRTELKPAAVKQRQSDAGAFSSPTMRAGFLGGHTG